ncbi:PIN domain-containing protein [bacterium]|nr:PIN domain-containing protein [bacterium]MBU1615223.1 PIN domain-containing protein [bacterium]
MPAKEKEIDSTIPLSLIQKVNKGELEALTSFYALIELFTIAVENAEDFKQGSSDAKDILLEILPTKLIISKMLTRQEKLMNSHLFREIVDPSDITHAVVAHLYRCEKIVTYDKHFLKASHLIPVVKPEDLL